MASDVVLEEPFIKHDVPVPDPFTYDEQVSNSSQCSSEDGSEDVSKTCQGSMDESSSMSDSISIDEPFLDTDFDLLDSYDGECGDSENLYPSSNITVTKSLALLFSWFCSSPGTSKESFSRLLKVLNAFILPDGNSLPSSYADALSAIKQFVIPVEKHDCCINDCIIFRKCPEGNFNELSECPKCSEPRYQCNTKIARKVFKYLPLAPRLNRMFKNENLSRDLQSHLTSRNSSIRHISDIHQSQAWKSRYCSSGPFHGDPRGISLSVCTDGMNPFSKEKVVYSMWPIVVTILNLPRRTRNLPGSILLVGIIPGSEEPRNMDPYLDMLVDEICLLNGSVFYVY